MKTIYPIIGMRHRGPEAEDLVRSLRAGEPITLERWPENQHDPHAVKVVARGVHVGYVPSAMARQGLSKYIDENGALPLGEQTGHTVEGKFVVSADRRPLVQIEERNPQP